jgi:crooked neck
MNGESVVRYEEAVSAQPHDYDAWFDYIRLEESEGNLDRARKVYERAIAQVFLTVAVATPWTDWEWAWR